MYIVTGGAGFIGSAVVWRLNQAGIDDILIVDHLSTSEKWKNLVNLSYNNYMHKNELIPAIRRGDLSDAKIKGIIHMGACSSTTETNADYLMENNFHYSQDLANFALDNGIRFVYASSGATFGRGEKGFSDADEVSKELKPINRYGYSKQLFDLWALRTGAADKIAGLKFFNVYGPNEYHKDEMASVIFKAFHQVREHNRIRLFKSYKPQYEHGEQKRDFVYVKDVVEVIYWLLSSPGTNGIYNVGTGTAQTWNQLAYAVFAALNKDPHIEYIEMPASLQEAYQYYTQAQIDKLRQAGYDKEFTPLAEGVSDYIQNYLTQHDAYLEAVSR